MNDGSRDSFDMLHPLITQATKGKGKATPSTAAKAAPASIVEVDKCCPKAGNKGVSVCTGHDAKMNQTNIASNNNKFYILQVRLERVLGKFSA